MGGTKKILHVTVTTDRQTSKKSFEVDSVIVGRNPDCLLPIAHHDISRRHLTLWIRGEEVWIEDLGSSNGTFINGGRLVPHSPQALFPTDRINVGASTGISLSAELETLVEEAPPPSLPETKEPSEHAETVIFAPPAPKAAPAEESPVAEEKPPEPEFSAADLELPPVRSAPSPRPKTPAQQIEISRLLQEARREADEILRMARLEAEHKVQEIFERAELTQKEAEDFYSRRMQEAYRSAESVYAEAKAEAEALLEKTRRACDEIRRQTNASTTEIRSRARKECDVLMREAETQARLMKEQRQQEAEALLARKEEQLVADIEESMALARQEMEERLRAEAEAHAEKLRRDRERLEAETAELRREHAILSEETASLTDRKRALEEGVAGDEKKQTELSALMKKLSAQGEELEKDLAAIEAEREKVSGELQAKKRDFEELSHQSKEIALKKETASREVEAEILKLKGRLETAKAKMKKEEEEQLVHLKLETAKQVQRTEKELLSEIARKKNAFVREILVSLEKSSSLIAGKVSEWRKETPAVEENLLGLIDGQLFAMKVEGASVPRKIDLGAQRRRERALHAGVGAIAGMLLVLLGFQGVNRLRGPSPLERAVASEAEARRKDLENRKFDPPKTRAWKDSYVDAVIYTERFVELSVSDDYQKRWSQAATKHLLKLWKVDEDSSLQVVSIANALVKTLAERKEKIHPDYVNDGLRKMKEAEDEAVKRMVGLLGSQVRFESLRKFEKEFFLASRDGR